jgi:hypothetical protein
MPALSTDFGLPRLRLIAPLVTTNSGSGTFLGLASDGNKYWIKAPNNPQGSRTLAAEVVVHGIGVLIGAPVRQTALIDIPDNMNWQYAPARRLKGGIGHASLNVEPAIVSDDWQEFSRHDHNETRQAFILALWDLCMGGDPQWIHQPDHDYTIWSFDHGFWLGGEGDWSAQSLRTTGIRPWVDLEFWVASAHGLRDAARAVHKLERTSIATVTQGVPIEWGIAREELRELANLLYLRVEGVVERLAQAARDRDSMLGGA